MTTEQRRIKALYKKVFTFDSSEADEKYFRQRIANYINDKEEEKEFDTLTKLLWDATWIRNEAGKYCKYLYFNERIQKLYLDNNFFEWAKLVCQELNELLK